MCLRNSHCLKEPTAAPFDDHFEILSVASPSIASMDENVGPAMPELTAPQGLIGSVHYCQRA